MFMNFGDCLKSSWICSRGSADLESPESDSPPEKRVFGKVNSGPSHTKMRSYLDAVRNEGIFIVFGGWACDRDGNPAPQLLVLADGHLVPLRELKSIRRPDVAKVFPGTSPNCGFHIVVEAAEIPENTEEIWLAAHDPRDNSTSIIKGHSGHATKWSAINPNRNQWKLPPESIAGTGRLLQAWKEDEIDLPVPWETGLTRAAYLNFIRDGVRYFLQYQHGNGAIYDPYRGEEFQYSTPCFAYAAALCAHERPEDAALAESAALAMDWSCKTLATRRAATAHEDFFPSPIAHAMELLATQVDSGRLEHWRSLLGSFDPFATYRHLVGGSGGPGSNWNCKALAGEYLLYKAGVRESLRFVEQSILAQGRFFNNEFGLYAEGPMVYDAFPRAWLGDMVAAGYNGVAADVLKEALDRGATTSLFLQSPNGELPCGGRSSHHVWADALQCVIFELAAARALKDGNRQLAGMHKRAAHKALQAISFWQRPTGEFWIVKNKAEPVSRHGHEPYSSHSQYNLLTLTALGYAYQHAGETELVEEQVTPSEGGYYVVDLPAPFAKVIASNKGTQVIVARARDGKQTPAGLLRVHFNECVPQVGPSDGVLAETGYMLPNTKRANLSIGLVWRTADTWRSIADLSDVSAVVSDQDANEAETSFKISYHIRDDSVSRVHESYSLSRNLLRVGYDIVGTADSLAIRVPVMVSDGRNESTLSVGENSVSVSLGRQMVSYSVENAEPRISDEVYGHRNGFARIVDFESKSHKNIQLRIRSMTRPY